MTRRDDSDWLSRLTSEEWMRAAKQELVKSYRLFEKKHHRPALAHARRAAGMALNARLRQAPDETYGRSYVEHLGALSQDTRAPEAIRNAASRLVGAPVVTELVSLGKGPVDLAQAAHLILEYVEETLK